MKRIAVAARMSARRAWLWRHRDRFGEARRAQIPRLLVDVSAIIRHDAQTGIQRVVRAVWCELSARSGRDFLALPVYATSSRGYCYAPADFLKRNAPAASAEPVSAAPGDKFLGLDLSAHYLPMYRSQLSAWRAHGASVHLLVYDLLPLLRPEWFNRSTGSHFRNWFDVLSEDADQAICISAQVARDLVEQLDRKRQQRRPAVGRLRMGGDIAASLPSTGLSPEVVRLLHQLRFRATILMVGTVEPRKAYDRALAAFEHLWSSRRTESPDLVIIGKGGWKTSALQTYIRSHPEHGKRLHWLDRVSDEGLCQLYDGCRGVLMASHAEGFGLPLVEAAMHRRHVLARDLAVFREQSLPNVLFFDDDRPAALGALLIKLSAIGQRAAPAAVNLPSWSESVDALLSELGLASDFSREPVSAMRKAS